MSYPCLLSVSLLMQQTPPPPHHGLLLGEVDQLVDGWLRTMFARYRHANEDAFDTQRSSETQVLQFLRRDAVELLRHLSVGSTGEERESETAEDTRTSVSLAVSRYGTILIAR